MFRLTDQFYFFEFAQLSANAWHVIIFLSLMMTEYLNSVLIVDLYLSITNPFVPRESRLKFYYVVPVLTILAFIALGVLSESGVIGNDALKFVAWYPVVFELVTFVCGLAVICLLCQERTSPELK